MVVPRTIDINLTERVVRSRSRQSEGKGCEKDEEGNIEQERDHEHWEGEPPPLVADVVLDEWVLEQL